MKDISISIIQSVLVLTILPLIFMFAFKITPPLVSSNSDSVISNFSYKTVHLAKFIENMSGLDMIENTQVIIKKDKLDTIDAFKNLFSLFMHGLVATSIIIILIFWIPLIGIFKGFYLGNFYIISAHLSSFIAVASILFGGILIIPYLWIGTLITETYTPAFFLIWLILGFIAIVLGLILGFYSYVGIILNIRNKAKNITFFSLLIGFFIAILYTAVMLIKGFF